jgi:site-specific recombinase XerD
LDVHSISRIDSDSAVSRFLDPAGRESRLSPNTLAAYRTDLMKWR